MGVSLGRGNFGECRGKTGLIIAALICALPVFSAGCTNNLARGFGSMNGIAVPPALGGGSNGATSPMVLANVIRDTISPATTFDLVGDGSGEMGQFCTPLSNSSSTGPTTGTTSGSGSTPSTGTGTAYGPSTCDCTYSYVAADGSNQSVEVNTSYFESNLIRCPYTAIPSGVASVNVSIHVTTTDTDTNPIAFNLNGPGSVTLDLTNPLSYLSATRYQCKDIVTVQYPLDTSIYDPIQSDDPEIAYPLDFYATNMAGAFSLYSGFGTQGWNCPPIPNGTQYGLNLNVYSEGADTSGSKLIYPPSGSAFDRSTFYLTTQPSGVFTVPVDAYLAPNVVSGASANSLTAPPLGYAASPIPITTGEETCPDTTSIPSGYHWVKVWLFRADLAPRHFVQSSAFQALGALGCNPGTFPSGAQVYPDCAGGATYTSAIADRILLINGVGATCIKLTAPLAPCGTSGPGCTTQNTGVPFAGYTQFAPGTDIWAEQNAGGTYDCAAIPSQSVYNPMNICTSSPVDVPNDSNPTIGTITSSATGTAETTRYDFLFVVSPPTVMSADMENSATAIHFTYTPYRFYSAKDCQSPDPDNPLTAGDCNPARAIRNYGLKLHDVATNGDPPASDPNRAGVFPVCAIQPN